MHVCENKSFIHFFLKLPCNYFNNEIKTYKIYVNAVEYYVRYTIRRNSTIVYYHACL